MNALTNLNYVEPVPLPGRQDADDARRSGSRSTSRSSSSTRAAPGIRSGTSSRTLAEPTRRRRRALRAAAANVLADGRARAGHPAPHLRRSRSGSTTSTATSCARSNGGWILVDTGLGTRDAEARWRPVLDELDAPVEAIVVTHMHPDHVGGARDVAELTGAPVLPGPRGPRAVRRARGGERDPERFAEYWRVARHAAGDGRGDRGRVGPAPRGRALGRAARPAARRRATRSTAGASRCCRGHADGHIVLLRDGVLIAGDTILAGITPAIGLYPRLAARPARRLPRDAAADRGARAPRRLRRPQGRRSPTRPGVRARSPRTTRERLRRTRGGARRHAASALRGLARAVPGPTCRRRCAASRTAEALAHLERLVYEDRAARDGDGLHEAPAIPFEA